MASVVRASGLSMRDVFAELDQDGDGSISHKELARGMQALGPWRAHPKSQSKPRFTRRISIIYHFICFMSAQYTRFS